MSNVTSADGRIPLTPSLLSKPLSGTGLCGSNQLVYDTASDNLLLTVINTAYDSLGSRCQTCLTAVKRITNLNAGTPNVCDEVIPGTLSQPWGIDVFTTAGQPPPTEPPVCDEKPGDVIVANAVKFAFPHDANLRLITANGCIPMTEAIDVRHGLNFPKGVAIGDFNHQATWGIYFTDLIVGTPTVTHLKRARPTPIPTECSWDPGAPLPHAVIPDSKAGVTVFDPFPSATRPSIFVTGDSIIWRVTKTPGAAPVQFALGVDFSLGISFPKTGVMLVSERGKLLVVDGWRFKFRRGDADISGLVDVSDIQFIMNWLFNGGPELACWDAADVNDDGIINIADSVYLSKWLFQGGPPPPAPGPTTIAVDPTGDMFGCKTYPGGEIPW